MTAAQLPLAYDPNQVKPGWVAFFLVMGLILATFLLWRSMNTQLGRIKVPPAAALRRDSGRDSAGSGEAREQAPPSTERPDDEPDDSARRP